MEVSSSKPQPERSLSELWDQALKDYEGKTKRSKDELAAVGDFRASNFNQVLEAQNAASNKFDAARHPPGTTDRIVQAVEPTLDWIVTGSTFIADHVSGTAAMPAKILSGAIAILVQAANIVTEDLNLVEQIFIDIKTAMEDASLFDGLVPDNPHFHKRLLEVFTTILEFCAFGINLFKHHGKVRLYFGSIGGKRSQKISEKSQSVTNAIKKFKDTIPYQNLAATMEIDRQVKKMPDNIIAAIRAAKIDPAILQSLASSADPIKHIKEKWRQHIATSGQLEGQMELIKSRFVRGTFDWLENDDNYKQWRLGKLSPFLVVYGDTGFGKTYLTYNVYQNLNQPLIDKQKPIVVIQLLDTEWRLKSLICNIILLIAEADKKFAENLERDLRNDTSPTAEKLRNADAAFLWEKYIEGKFRRGLDTSRTLYLLLDGVQRTDMLNDLYSLLNMFERLDSRRHSVQILLTGEESLSEKLGDLRTSKIKLSGKTNEDVKKVIKQRFDNSVTLKQFSNKASGDILKHLSEKANGDMSFIDVSLSRLEQIGTEKVALEELKRFQRGPENVYESMIKLITESRSAEHRRIIESLFTWLALAKEPFSVSQINHLLRIDHTLEMFDIRSEINDQLRSLLFISNSSLDQTRPKEVTKTDANKTSAIVDISIYDTEVVEPFKEGFDLIHFRQPSLRDFLRRRPNDLMPQQLDRQVKTFTTLCDILSVYSSRDKPIIASLQKYALRFFGEHLRDIDISKTNEQLTNDVVIRLADILLDHNRMHETIEHYVTTMRYNWIEFELYDPPEWAGAEQSLRDLIVKWGRKMKYYGHQNLQPFALTAEDWVNTLDKTLDLTCRLGIGHCRSWFGKIHKDEALKAFKLAYRAFGSTTYMTEYRTNDWISNSTTTVESVELVFEILDRIEKDLSPEEMISRRGSKIAAALILNTPDSSKRARIHARKLYVEALQNSTGAERFYCLVGLAEYFYAFKKFGKAKDVAAKAVTELEDELGALGTDLDDNRAIKAFRLLALSHDALGESEEAVYNFKRGLDRYQYVKDSEDLILLFDDMIIALGQHMNYHGIMSEVLQRPKSLRRDWMKLRSLSADEALNGDEDLQYIGLGEEYLRRAAFETRKQDPLVRLYEDAISYWTDESILGCLSLQYDLALIYRDDLRVTKTSRELLTSMLKATRDDLPPGTPIANRIITALIEIYHQDFFLTDSIIEKQSTLDRISKLLTEMVQIDRIQTSTQAAGQLILARMLRSSSRLEDCKKAARNAFSICIADLEDSVGYNDWDAFVVLARCLAFVDLETDAQIAGSLRLAKISDSYWDERSAPAKTTPADEAEDDLLSDDEQDIGDNSELKSGTMHNEAAPTSGGGAAQNLQDVNDKPLDRDTVPSNQSTTEPKQIITDGTDSSDLNLSNSVIDVTQPKPKSSEIDASGPDLELTDAEPAAAVKVAGSPEAAARGENPKSVTPSNQVGLKPLPTVVSMDVVEEEDESDQLLNGAYESFSCSGDCRYKAYTKWASGAPGWMCLDCQFVDLCQDCYEVQQAFNENRGMGCWSKICWGPHRFIRQPIEGWRGVKNGVIRRGNKQKDVKEWLSDIKKRWEKQLEVMELTSNKGSDGVVASSRI